MFKQKKEYEKFLKKIKPNANICIYGSNETAEKLYDEIKEQRPDIIVKFFIDSKNEGDISGTPVYLAENLDEHLEEFDMAIIASYSHRFYMEFILKSFGVQNILMINKNMLIETQKVDKYDKEFLNQNANILKTSKERKLYKFIAKARKNRKKYEPLIKEYYDKKYQNRVDLYPFEHYFEFINREAIHTIIDGGACNGIHSILSLQMLPNCKKVYAFEPCYDSFKNNLFDKLINRHKEIEIVQKALWKENTDLTFREELDFKAASAVLEKKPNISRPQRIITVPATTIDSFVENNSDKNIKIDFIKMDLENAEQEALQGAEKTILRDRPQLAISIYHSNEQFYEIPKYLKNLLPNYVFRLGHYRDTICETVLYAIPKELEK